MVVCNQLVKWFVPILFCLTCYKYQCDLQPYNLTKFCCCHQNVVPIQGCSVKFSLLKEGLKGKLKTMSITRVENISGFFVCILIIIRKMFNFLEVDVKNCTLIGV
jgi:hypothetical protein